MATTMVASDVPDKNKKRSVSKWAKALKRRGVTPLAQQSSQWGPMAPTGV